MSEKVVPPAPHRRLIALLGPGMIVYRTAPQAIDRTDRAQRKRTRRRQAIHGRRAISHLAQVGRTPAHQRVGGSPHARVRVSRRDCSHRAGQTTYRRWHRTGCSCAVPKLPVIVVAPARHITGGRQRAGMESTRDYAIYDDSTSTQATHLIRNQTVICRSAVTDFAVLVVAPTPHRAGQSQGAVVVRACRDRDDARGQAADSHGVRATRRRTVAEFAVGVVSPTNYITSRRQCAGVGNTRCNGAHVAQAGTDWNAEVGGRAA